MSFDQLAAELLARQEAGLFRHRRLVESPQQPVLTVEGSEYLSFCSNDYLGLANHPKVIAAFQEAAGRYGVGGGASHLVCGHHYEHHALEEEFAEFLGRPRALLFSTGYMANIGVMNALLDKRDAVFQDKWNQASLLDGGVMSGARFQRFLHNDLNSLESKLVRSEARRKLVVVDGVFSMDGDLADLPGICDLAKQQGAWVMVDDAHGFGCIGPGGRGTPAHFGLGLEEVPIQVCTLGKGVGTFGAVVAGSEAMIETLVQFARTYIYTTALPPAIAAATRAALRVMAEEPWRLQRLQERVAQFCSGADELNLPLMPSTTAIQPLLVGDAKRAVAVSEALENKGILISAIRPPTVPAGSARLRITLCADHEPAHIERLLEVLFDVMSDSISSLNDVTE